MAVGRFFFSAALTAQNSPELHIRFINSFIQPSRVGSLEGTPLGRNERMNEKKEADSCRQRGTIKHSYICPFSVVVGSLESERQFWQPATASVAVTH